MSRPTASANCLILKYIEPVPYTNNIKTYVLDEIYTTKFIENLISEIKVGDDYWGFTTLKIHCIEYISRQTYDTIMRFDLTNDEDDIIKLLN
jgi:hypothetical protein